MDYLFFCTGECDDAMRDRDFFLVRACPDEDYARVKLARFFQDSDWTADAETYSVFVKGEKLDDGMLGLQHWCYRMYYVE